MFVEFRQMFNPQPDPQKSYSYETWDDFGVPHASVSRLKLIRPALSRKRSRVRAPSSPPYKTKNLSLYGSYSDNPQSNPQITALDDFQVLLRLGKRPALPAFRRDHPACRDSWSCGYRYAARFPEPS